MDGLMTITLVGAVTAASAIGAVGVSWLLLKLVLESMSRAAHRSRR
jgi:hypothetical protein